MSNPSIERLPLLDRYSTNRNDLVAEFYEPCLGASVDYDRTVGYSRSSVLLLASEAVADFAAGDKMIGSICSPELTREDIDGLEKGYEGRGTVGRALRGVMGRAIEDPLGRPIVEFPATLVAVGCLDVRIAVRPDARGMFRDKVGIFRDGEGHSVSFTGFSNETFSAWNPESDYESFDVFRSWTGEGARVAQHVGYFERLWNDLEPGVETMDFPDVARDRLLAVSDPDGAKAA